MRQEDEQLMSGYFDSAPGFFYTLVQGRNGVYAMPFASAGMRDLFGVEPGEVTQDIAPFVAVVHPDDSGTIFREIEASARSLACCQFEFRIDHPQKGLRWIAAHSKPQNNSDGGVSWGGFMHDITGRKRAEIESWQRERESLIPAGHMHGEAAGNLGALKEAQHRTEQFFSNFPGFAYSFRMTPDGHGSFPFASPGIEKLYGLKPADVKDDMAPLHALTHPDDAPRVIAAIAESARTMTHAQMEYRICRPGQPERWMEFRSSPVREADGSILWHGIMLDITARKRMESELVLREQVFRSLAESSPDVVIRVDRDLRIRYLNANMLNYLELGSAEEVIGRRSIEIWPDGRFNEIDALRERVVTTGEMASIELVVPVPGGKVAYHQVISVPERDVDGHIIGTLTFGRDITAIREIERRLSSLVESLPGIAYTLRLSPEGEMSFLYVSAGVKEIYGITPEAAMGDFSAMHALIHPDDKSGMEALFAESMRTLTPFRVEMRICPYGLSERWLDVRSDPQVQPDGNILWYGLIFDITERKHLEQSLVEREREFRSLAENSLDVIVRYDLELRRTYINPAWALANGISVEEALGKRPTEMAAVVSDSAREFEDELRKVRESGEPEEIEISGKDRLGKMKHFSMRVVPEYGKDGSVISLLTMANDVAERKQFELELQNNFDRIYTLNETLEQKARELEEQAVELEMSKEQLQQTEAWYRSILHSAPDGMLVVDSRGLIIQVNAQLEAMFGYGGGELAGCNVEVLLPKIARTAHAEKRAAFISGGQRERRMAGVAEDLFGRRKDGSEFPVDVSLSRLPDLDGRAGAVCAAVRDVTERQKMDAARESALSEALRLAQLRSAFLAHMSHELRTPLNGILGYAQNLLLQGESMSEKQITWVRIIQNSGEHLLTLINGILDHAAIEADKFELIYGDIELESFLGTIIGMIRVRAEQKNLSFTCDAGEDLPAVVRGDALRLRQILLNLLANAVKFTDRGQVILRVKYVAPSRLCFAVRDSGVGIAAEQLESIFNPFEQTGESNRRAGGNGLGLAISRKLVRLMGGEIKVESELGEGSTFSFEIEMECVQSAVDKVNAAALSEQAATTVVQPTQLLFAPPRQELDSLYALALRGSMRNMLLHAEKLVEADGRYIPFVEQLRQLAKGFQTKALVNLLQAYREGSEVHGIRG